jgi:hypothetical protein
MSKDEAYSSSFSNLTGASNNRSRPTGYTSALHQCKLYNVPRYKTDIKSRP